MLPPDLATPIGSSPNFLETLNQASRVAPLARPVLLIGERGTGKELLAARLHYLSPRWDRPFVKLNCGGLAPSLLEAELFGHEAGAFTGAQKRRAGRFETAHRGTLFLDEIANAPLTVQETILRVVEYGSFERVGGSDSLQVDVRLVAATNLDLPSLAARGEFRADLLDRLAFDVITLPPLRHRRDDILLLADHIAVQMTQELRRDYFPGFSPACQAMLLAHDWPGNVRELKNTVERAVYRSEPGQPVEQIILDPFESPWRPGGVPTPGPADPPLPSATSRPTDLSPDMPSLADAAAADGPGDFNARVAAFERRMLETALDAHDRHQGRTAAALGLSYHQLRGQLRKHGLIGGPV